MLTCNIKLKIFDPSAPAATITPDTIALGHRFIPHDGDPPDSAGESAAAPSTPTGSGQVDGIKFGGGIFTTLGDSTRRRPLRDLTRAGLVRAVGSASSNGYSDTAVNDLIGELLEGRPFLAWLVEQLRTMTVEQLVGVLLSLLKLAA